jgi:hypothetical protein
VTNDASKLSGPSGTAGGDEPPDEIEELAENCRQYVLSATGVELDYTPETLSVVDHYVRHARAGLEERRELEPLIVRAVGAYFGEVVRRTVPSFWVLATADVFDWSLCAKTAYLSFNPIGVAYDALSGGTAHDGPSSELKVSPAEREIVAQRLEELPDVSEDEYYLLTTRLEVIEATVMALRLEMQQQGTSDVVFTESDYDEAEN